MIRVPTSDEKSSVTTLHLAYAEASLMLLESLMFTLIERGVVTIDDISDALRLTIETKTQFVQEGMHAEISKIAGGVLKGIANSVAAAKP